MVDCCQLFVGMLVWLDGRKFFSHHSNSTSININILSFRLFLGRFLVLNYNWNFLLSFWEENSFTTNSFFVILALRSLFDNFKIIASIYSFPPLLVRFLAQMIQFGSKKKKLLFSETHVSPRSVSLFSTSILYCIYSFESSIFYYVWLFRFFELKENRSF